jgi:2-methylisocitrate lyase-like PEP mutase family enzyme
MSTNFERFKKLHHAKSLFILPNAWDAKSAFLFEENKFPAVGTSSAAVSASLGYEDGEGMPFSDYLFVIRRILASVKIPVTIDLEMGYGKNNAEIFDNIQQLVELGVAGINIEDSEINNSKRSLRDAKEFAKTIEYIKEKLASKKLSLFVNIRCDTYILPIKDKQKETLHRLKIYETTGADGIFLPCISSEADITEAVSNTKLPINVMCIPGLPDFDTLNKLGVKRASMGPFLFNKTYKKASELGRKVADMKSFSPVI